MSGGSAKRFLIENPGVCPRRVFEARSRRVGGNLLERGAFGLAALSSIREFGSGRWVKINGKLNA